MTITSASPRHFIYLDLLGIETIAAQLNIHSSLQNCHLLSPATRRKAMSLIMRLENKLEKESGIRRIRCAKDIGKIQRDEVPTLVSGRIPLTAVGLYDSQSIFHEITKASYVTLRLDQSALTEDFSFWHDVLLGGSLNKFLDAYDGWHNHTSGHFRIFLNSMTRTSADFGVFAQARATGEILQLKPYAIWF